MGPNKILPVNLLPCLPLLPHKIVRLESRCQDTKTWFVSLLWIGWNGCSVLVVVSLDPGLAFPSKLSRNAALEDEILSVVNNFVVSSSSSARFLVAVGKYFHRFPMPEPLSVLDLVALGGCMVVARIVIGVELASTTPWTRVPETIVIV